MVKYMNINDILTEIEYTKARSAKEFFEWFNLKEEELRAWSWEHSGTKAHREIKHRELSKGLPIKFTHELTPFAYYANTYYSNKPEVRFGPRCGSEPYDGIIIDNGNKVFVEITNAIDGKIWGLQKELLIENGHSPWEHNIHGVKGNKTKLNRTVSDIIVSNEFTNCKDTICKTKELVKETAFNKCKKSLEQKLPYGQGKTILIVTFDNTGFREKEREDFIDFKQIEIDSMKHNFKRIILFGWLSYEFIA
jgi:hypothetical protein